MLKRTLGLAAAGMVLSGTAVAGVLAAPATTWASGHNQAQVKAMASRKVNLLESGSTLLYPLFEKWIPVYERQHQGVSITPAGTGSGTGISEALAGTIQIGASDAYMSNSQMTPDMENIPLAISAQVVAYNLPGLNNKHLNLSGSILAGIYTGKIKNWNDRAIQKANPHVKLPNHAIIPVRRSDASGDSFLFTTYMTDTAPQVWTVGFNTSPSWPAVSNEVSAEGNGGMVQALQQNKYAIAYVGISYLNEMVHDKLGYGALQNKNGNYVMPIRNNIVAAAQAMVPHTPKDERVSLIYAPGKTSYPIINYEYAIVKKTQSSKAVANAMKTFLMWDIQVGNQGKFLNTVHFLPLPASVRTLSFHQIRNIH